VIYDHVRVEKHNPSIPFHLTTKRFNQSVHSMVNEIG